MTGSVVVGYDGSDHADAAVDWAAAEAARRGQPLVVLYAANYAGLMVGTGGAGAWLPPEASVAAEQVAQQGAERAHKVDADLRVETVAVLIDAVRALTTASRSASLVVVGTRGHGRVVGTLLGSVAFGVTAHAGCPVVVVRGESHEPAGSGRPVVVGVDGSACADAAADAAAAYAESVGAELQLVTAWQIDEGASWASAYWAEMYPGQRPADVAEKAAEEVLTTARDRLVEARPQLQVTTKAVEGHAAKVVAQASRGAGMVFVGARGRGDFKSLLLGSVSRGVVHDAACPVQVVRTS